MPAKYVGKGGGAEASIRSTSQAMIPDEHREFVQKVLDEAGIPPLPATTQARECARPPASTSTRRGPARWRCRSAHAGVRMIVNALGPPPKYVLDQAHDAGLLVGALVGAKQHAERQVALGVDVLVAQGTEAGGHCGEISTMVLVPAGGRRGRARRARARRRRHRRRPPDGGGDGARRAGRVDGARSGCSPRRPT